MEITSATALISINETFFIQLISFLVFLFILNRVMIRPLTNTMEQRKGHFAEVATDIERAKSDLNQINRDLDRQRAQMIKEANHAVILLHEEADKSAADLFNATQSQIIELRHETEARIHQRIQETRAQLAGEVEAVSTAILEKVLNRRLQ